MHRRKPSKVRIIERFKKAYKEIIKVDAPVSLLYGITGSGKTEIYFKLIEDTIKKGKNVLFLAPEIALVSQLTIRTIKRFGADILAIWHSSITESEKYSVWQKLRNDEIKILTILNENPNISNVELLEITNHDKESGIINKKSILLKRIRNSKILMSIVSSKFPNIKINEPSINGRLSENEKELITLLRDEEESDLIVDQAKKIKLFDKLGTSESLKREALSIYPELIISDNISGISLTFTSMEVDFLQEFCLVKNNNLIYQSLEDIAKSLNLSKNIIEIARGTSKAKVIKNMIVGNNLDNLLWSNFTDEFIARDNLSSTNSVKISEDSLKNIDLNNIKNILNEGIKLLEKSIFKDYISVCSKLEKIVLALRLGFFNKRFFTSSEVADIMSVDENYVIELTKDCLKRSKESYIDSNIIVKNK